MQWGLYLDKGDVHFTVIYDRDVFRAIEPFFNIQEIDEDIIVGNYEMQRNAHFYWPAWHFNIHYI